MNTQQPPAANAPSRVSDKTPTAEETLVAHARRALRTRLRARITTVLDAGIASLKTLRNKAGGEQGATEDEDRSGARNDRPRERQGSAAPQLEAEAPKPKRRLRAFLIYVGVMLAGGLGGGALAYTQFQKRLDVQIEASLKREAALAKQTRPVAETLKTFEEEMTRRDLMEKKLASAFAEFTASTDTSYAQLRNLLGQQFAESRRLETALEAEQSTRAEAEEKLALALAENAKSASAKQRQLDAVQKQLAMLDSGEGTRHVQREAPTSSRNRAPRSGNCTMSAGNVDSLKGCIDDFNR